MDELQLMRKFEKLLDALQGFDEETHTRTLAWMRARLGYEAPPSYVRPPDSK